MELTVLGKSPSWQDRDGACSGYLAALGEQLLLIDCGNAVFGKLRAQCAYERVDAVVISHMHADHVLDLVPFSFALTYGPQLRSSRPLLHLPPGGRAALRALCGAWGMATLIEDAFEIHEYDPGAELSTGIARLRFQPVPHYVPANAIELRSDGAAERVVFSADCGPNDVLAPFAEGAELLLIESTLMDAVDGERAGHLSAAQAGAIGRQAGIARVVLTHFSDQLDAEELRARASAALGGPVELAVPGATYMI